MLIESSRALKIHMSGWLGDGIVCRGGVQAHRTRTTKFWGEVTCLRCLHWAPEGIRPVEIRKPKVHKWWGANSLIACGVKTASVSIRWQDVTCSPLHKDGPGTSDPHRHGALLYDLLPLPRTERQYHANLPLPGVKREGHLGRGICRRPREVPSPGWGSAGQVHSEGEVMTVKEVIEALLEESVGLEKGVNSDVEFFTGPEEKVILTGLYAAPESQTLCFDVEKEEEKP